MIPPDRTMKILLLTFCTALGWASSPCAAAPEYPTDVSKWIRVKAPLTNYGESKASDPSPLLAEDPTYDWEVRSSPAGVSAHLLEEDPAEKKPYPGFDTTVQVENRKAKASQALKVDDGWILAYNKGEFGAAVYWCSEDGLTRKKFSELSVNKFMMEGDRIFAVEGLAHMSDTHGSMIEIKKGAAGWEVSEFLAFPSSAEAITRIAEGDYVIATVRMLLRVNL